MSGPVDVREWIAGKVRAAAAMEVVHAGESAGAGVRKREAAVAEAVHVAVCGLIDKARGLADVVEFRIDDPRAALLDELRAAITAVGGAA